MPVSLLLLILIAGQVQANSRPAQAGLFAPADSAITAATNPAGMTRLEDPEWVFQGVLFLSDSTFVQSAESFGGEQRIDDDGWLAAPLIYYVRPLSDRWSVGFSGTAFGLGEEVGGGPSRYLVTEWALVSASFSPAIAYRLNDSLSIGAALNINYTYYFYESAVFNPEPDIDDGVMEIESDDVSFSGQLSLFWEPNERTRVGLNYKSEIEPELADVPDFSGLGPTREMMLEQGGALSQEVVFDAITPRSIGAGIWHELSDGTSLTLDVAWVEFSEFGLSSFTVGDDTVNVNSQDFKDIWALSMGVNYPLNKNLVLKAGFMATSEFVDDVDRTKTLLLDQVVGGGIGVEYRWTDNRLLALNLNYYDLGQSPIEVEIPQLGTVTGEYTKNESIGIDVSFRWIR